MGLTAPKQFGSEAAVPEGRMPRVLGMVEVDAPAAVWWCGVHGGAGESTLERIFRGSRASDHRWPIVRLGDPIPAVVLAARTDARGLRAVQRAMREHLESALPVDVVGLVLMADAPGRLPRVLRDLAGVVGGTVPRVWSLPWVEAWRAGEVPSPANSPKEADRLAAELRAALGLDQKGRMA
jgi:hypothetical protein